MLSSELQRRPRRTNEFVGEGELPSRHCARPYGRRLRRGTHTIATHLHQFDGRVNATDGTQREICRSNDDNGIEFLSGDGAQWLYAALV